MLEAAVAEARDAGVRTLVAAGQEDEWEFAFGVALRLLEPVVRDASPSHRDVLFQGAAARARPLLTGEVSSDPGSDELFPVLHGLWWVLANLADSAPLLLAVDDLHWADEASLRLLAFVVSRIGDTAISFIGTARAGETQPGEPAGDLLLAPEVSVRELTALSDDEVAAVVQGRMPGADHAFAAACARASGGNPLLLTQLLSALVTEGTAPTAANARAVPALTPDAVRRHVDRELARRSETAVAVCRAVATLGYGAPLARVAALAGVPSADAGTAADELVAAGLLAAGDEIALVHPLVREGVLAALSPRERGAAHARAAAFLRADGESPERIAAHLLRAERLGDGDAVSDLCRAADEARSRGASSSAVAYLTRALEEPPPGARRASVAYELGTSEAAVGAPEAAGHLREALDARAAEPLLRARAALRLGQLLVVQGDPAEGERVLGAGVEVLGGERSVLARELLAARAMAAAYQPGRGGEAQAEDLERLAPGHMTGLERSVLAQQALQGAFALTLPLDDVLELVKETLRGVGLLHEASADSLTLRFVTGTLVLTEAIELELDLLDAVVERERARGALMGYATASYSRAFPLFIAGRVDEAIADLEAALAAVPHGWSLFVPPARALLGRAHIERGEPELARAALELAPEPQWTGSVLWHVLVTARAEFALEDGRPQDALALAEEARVGARAMGLRNPAGHEAGLAGLAHLALGHPEEARAAAEDELERARRWGAPGTLGAALRTMAAVEGRERGVSLLLEAAGALEGSPCLLERTRVLVDLGAALRGAGEAERAREPLREALDLADRLGLWLLADRAREELVASGARPRRTARTGPAALTPAERRVAELAAGQMTNREIAQALFVTVKAVEKHLSSVFAKLGITSRRELPEELRGAMEQAVVGG